jgi:hypothetical protein
MADGRIPGFRKWWYGEYKKKFGKPYKWIHGKEDKNLQRLLAYFDEHYKDEAEVYLYDSAMRYFEETSHFYHDHEFSLYAQAPFKWVVSLKPSKQPPPVAEVVKKRETPRTPKDDRELLTWLHKNNVYGGTNAEWCVKGLARRKFRAEAVKTTSPATKQWDKHLANLCIQVLGLERCKEISAQAKKKFVSLAKSI